jgi:hypothetical protein
VIDQEADLHPDAVADEPGVDAVVEGLDAVEHELP